MCLYQGQFIMPQHNATATITPPAEKTVSHILGEAVWLLTQSARHKKMELADLEWLIMPAIMLRQFKLFYNGEQPVGLALWAMVDSSVAARMDAGDNRLTVAEWKCGEEFRIVDVIAPFGREGEMRKSIEINFYSSANNKNLK
jgi:cytolysin-activating lysine-acyltransferase